ARSHGRVHRGVQRILRHRPPHHGRQDPGGRAGRGRLTMATTVENWRDPSGIAAPYRVCPATGLKVDIAAQRLIKANAVAAVVFLAIGGLFGLMVALTRWPAVHLLDAEWFYLILTAHGFDVRMAWIIVFEVGGVYFAATVLLNCGLGARRL